MLRQHVPSQMSFRVVCIPSHLRGRARREAAAFYLSQIAQGLLAGEFGILTGHETASAWPTDALTLEITFTRKLRADLLSVRLRWSRPEPGDAAGAAERRADRQALQERRASHPEFTSPSFGRNTVGRDYRQEDADDERHE